MSFPYLRSIIVTLPFSVSCLRPFLVAKFFEPQRMLSWSLTHPGTCVAQRVAWIEVCNTDLPRDTDAASYISQRMAEADLSDAVALVTSRDIRRHHVSQSIVEDDVATCLTTVGLSNGERVGQRISTPVPLAGTINTLLHVSLPLSESAFLETMSLVTQARTAAVLDADVRRSGVAVTGTGTDCIVVAAPAEDAGAQFAGLHTASGEAVGAAVYDATQAGIETWKLDLDAFFARTAAQA